MKKTTLKVTEQIAVSAIRAETLRPGEIVEVAETLANELLASRPDAFEAVKAAPRARNKAAPEPSNKSDPAA